MADAQVFVTWPMEPEVRALVERAGGVEASPTAEELPEPELRRRVAGAEELATRTVENCLAALAGERPPNLVNPEAWPA